MMVVEKDIKEKVLNALYSQMGMAKHAKGIAFSLPVSDVAGLMQIPVETKEELYREFMKLYLQLQLFLRK